MQLVAITLGVLIAVLGAAGIVAPNRLLAIARPLMSPSGLYAVAAIRLVLGGALFLAAPTSREPTVLRLLGIIIVIAGIITPLVDLDRQRRLFDWWAARGPAVNRIGAAFGLAFGLFIVYAMTP